MAAYEFGKTFFSNYIWIAKGQLFNMPNNLAIEMITTGSFALEGYNAAGVRVYRDDRANPHGGWSSFSISLSPGVYKFKLVNTSPGTRQVLQGALYYT